MSTAKLLNALQDIPESASTSWNIRNANHDIPDNPKTWTKLKHLRNK